MQIREILFITVVLAFVSFTLVGASGTPSCPNEKAVTDCFPKCRSDSECARGKKCCRNVCGAKTCATLVVNGIDLREAKRQENIMCGIAKCLAGQRCGTDASKRPKCVDSKKEGVQCGNKRCLLGQKCRSESPMKRPECV